MALSLAFIVILSEEQMAAEFLESIRIFPEFLDQTALANDLKKFGEQKHKHKTRKSKKS